MVQVIPMKRKCVVCQSVRRFGMQCVNFPGSHASLQRNKRETTNISVILLCFDFLKCQRSRKTEIRSVDGPVCNAYAAGTIPAAFFPLRIRQMHKALAVHIRPGETN